MGVSLYRRYRPQKFCEVSAQGAAVDVLVRSLERSRVSHAYLFSGPRGCGKTTVARLLAKALNCSSPIKDESAHSYEPCCLCGHCLSITAGDSLDVIEIDGASNNGVDEVRELKNHVALAPFSSRYKVYIIDEVHMLSTAAFNALLKTLEEPPECVVFILATTEAHKVPLTIRSRCQHIPFHRIDAKAIFDRLAAVSEAESIRCQSDAMWEIARSADGALRDALSMFEQVANLGKDDITTADVEAVLGQGSRSSLERWFSLWRCGDMSSFVDLNKMLSSGASASRFLEELFTLSRDLWLVSGSDSPAKAAPLLDALDASAQEREYLLSEAPKWNRKDLSSILGFLASLMPMARLGMRTDVLSGLLMSRMEKIGAGENTESVKSAVGATAPGRTDNIARPSPVVRPEPAAASNITQPASRRDNDISEPAQSVQSVQPAQSEETGDRSGGAPLPPASEPSPLPPADTWTACDNDKWQAALSLLKENEFPLYCGLFDASPFTASGFFVIKIDHRYAYETLRVERNRINLKKRLTEIFEGLDIALSYKNLWTICAVQAQKTPAPAKRKSSKKAAPAPEADVSFERPDMSPDTPAEARFVSPGSPQSRFDDIVSEAVRWLGADVLLSRRGDAEATEEDDDLAGQVDD
ncbi:hypothetical protein FACS1894187_03090 [Synergistales bacterium]|nr:hypothetical protein FACS1894187_03090 [Synergistales bacterium]